jgi:hypothetical protein
VIDPEMGTDIPRCRDEDRVAREQVRNKRRIQIDDRRQRIKWPLVSAPSDPAPVVEGDLPVTLQMNSIKSSGSSR